MLVAELCSAVPSGGGIQVPKEDLSEGAFADVHGDHSRRRGGGDEDGPAAATEVVEAEHARRVDRAVAAEEAGAGDRAPPQLARGRGADEDVQRFGAREDDLQEVVGEVADAGRRRVGHRRARFFFCARVASAWPPSCSHAALYLCVLDVRLIDFV